MAQTTTTKLINLAQLCREMSGAPLSMCTASGTSVVSGDTGQAALDSAIAAHVAVDEDANASTLRDQATTALQGNRDYLAVVSPTNAQVAAQVKALTRQNNGIIRLLLGKLDGTN